MCFDPGDFFCTEVSGTADQQQTTIDDSDCGLLADLHERCFAKPWRKQDFIDLLHRPTTRIIMMRSFHDQQLMCGLLVTDMILPEIEILTFCIDPVMRKKGLGKILLNHMIMKYAECRFLLEVAEDNIPAIQLYTSLGFEIVSRRKGYYGQDQDALMLQMPATQR